MTEKTTAPAMSADEVLRILRRLDNALLSRRATPAECVELNEATGAVADLIAEREEQARWIAHLSAFIGPSAMPNIRKAFEEGRAPGGACVARAEGCGNG
jgi:hypothetical protein